MTNRLGVALAARHSYAGLSVLKDESWRSFSRMRASGSVRKPEIACYVRELGVPWMSGASVPDGYYRSFVHPNMIFLKRSDGPHVSASFPVRHDTSRIGRNRVLAHPKTIERKMVASEDFPIYDPDAFRYRPRLKGDHPYRTTTKFHRNPEGGFVKDAEGYLMPFPHPKDEPFKITRTDEDRAAGRERSRKKAIIEKRAITRMRNKIEKRQSIGDPDCVKSRDEDFPLLAVLRRDKLDNMISAVMAYRRLVALCEAEPLKGQSYGQANGMEREYETRKMKGVADVDQAAADGFKGTHVPGGEIVYERRVRKSNSAYSVPARRKLAAVAKQDGDEVVGRTESLNIKLNEDTLADYIDSKPRLARIRAALGLLCAPVEDAVLGGKTLGWIGGQEGQTGRTAEIAGKTLVYRGLTVLDGFLGAKKLKAANDNYLIAYKKAA